MKRILLMLVVAIAAVGMVWGAATAVPGQLKKCDADNNDIGDAGCYIVGHYNSVFAYEGEYGPGDYPQEGWYWDLGDGRVYHSAGINSIDDLDQERLTVCDYVVNYRADFNNDPFMDEGWIQNHINCYGYDDNGHYNYLIVSQTDPRWTGMGLDPGWGPNWEYAVLTESHWGNIVKNNRG